MPGFNNASVKVMRSYDYCHFEVSLSSDSVSSVEEVDELRKQAQRLADKAVHQYQVAKNLNWSEVNGEDKRRRLAQEVAAIIQKPTQDRTPEEQAKVKLLDDDDYWRNRRFYDYQDDWDDDGPY